MKLAILGTRGVPPAYGGFETFAAELGMRLVQRDHEVTVYCRRMKGAESTEQPVWNGIQRIVLPALRHKYFETVSHSFLSALDALRRDFDAVLICNAANAFVIPILQAARVPVAINVDGIERNRRKWNVLGRMVYAMGERFSADFADAVVADANVIADYYNEHYSIAPVMIPYGAGFPDEQDSGVLERLGLRPRQYLLYVSRFEPENNPLEVVEAYEAVCEAVDGIGQNANYGSSGYRQLPTANRQPERSPANRQPPTANCPLVMLGTGLYAPELVAALHAHRSEHILFPGALYGKDYRTLQRNALLYVQATEVGGTHPALIEAMASGGAVVAHDTPENREVGGDAVGYFTLRPVETLSSTILELLASPQRLEELRQRARRRAEEQYSWERVTDAYEALFAGLARKG